MRKTISSRVRGNTEDGQALILFVAAFVLFLGFVGLSVDVGRLMWAKAEMQSSVDSSALAGAQSMPEGSTAAQTLATQFWDSNKAAIIDNGENVTFDVTFPGGNRSVRVEATADIPTYFLRFFGVDHWDVSAVGKAESQVLDIALVLDISGSMCFTSYPPVEGDGPDWKGIVMGPGRSSPAGFAQPKLAANPYPENGALTKIPATTDNTINIKLTDVSIFTTTNNGSRETLFGGYWNTGGSSTNGKRYHEISPNGARAGIIMIDNELFKINSVDSGNKTLNVTRGQFNYISDTYTTKTEHFAGTVVQANRSISGSSGYCNQASPNARTSSTAGPHQPFDSALDNSQYFINLFMPTYDKIGVARYDSTATVVSNLTGGTTGGSYSSLISAINGFPYPQGGTNIAHGIAKGREIINGTGKRPNAIKIVVVLTDGVPTNYCSGATSTSSTYGSNSCGEATSDTPNTCPASTTAITHAINQAGVAKTEGMIVYTIGLGNLVLDCTLQSIATAGGGTYYKAPTTAQLDDAFRAIAEKTHIGLTD